MGSEERLDVVIVGAGFAGLYALHRLRAEGKKVLVFEAGDDVGGTWYWNRYPGARCDAESLAYSFSFDEALEQEWEWSERYATQPEILRYAQHVSERFDLRRDIRFSTRVTQAHFDEPANVWRVLTEQGDAFSAPICIMATGCLSVPLVPDIPGLDDFAGRRLQASLWPHEPTTFEGERVAVIGTGSSAIQAIPIIAETAEHLTVLQRTPNFSVPAANGPLDPDFVAGVKSNYREHRRYHKLGLSSGFGDLEVQPRERTPVAETAAVLSDEAFDAACEERWQRGWCVFYGRGHGCHDEPGVERATRRFCTSKNQVDRQRSADGEVAVSHVSPDRHKTHLCGHRLLRNVQPRERPTG